MMFRAYVDLSISLCPSFKNSNKDDRKSNVLFRAAFDNVGRLVKDDELNAMLSEVGGSCNYDNMIKVNRSKKYKISVAAGTPKSI